MSSNRTYADERGKFPDYIEVRNTSGSAVDISNYKLSDNQASIGYTFPQGTVLQPYSSIVCWCDPDDKSGAYASFRIAKEGGETVYLYNSTNVIIDQVTMPAMQTNVPYQRGEDGAWTVGTFGSPGFENTLAGYEAWLQSKGVKPVDVLITEVQSSNLSMPVNGLVCDWIELYNPGAVDADLTGYYLSDDPADPLKWKITDLTVKAGTFAVIRCTGGDGVSDAGFALDRSGCTVVLSGPMGNTVTTIQCPEMNTGMSWAMQMDGSYAATTMVTPGFDNDAMGYAALLEQLGVSAPDVVISELQSSNCSTILSASGTLCDWVELHNGGKAPVTLSGCYLSDDENDLQKWLLPDLTIPAGGFVVIPCVGDGAKNLEADFKLAQTGGTVVLSGPVGNIISQVEYDYMDDDRSCLLLGDGSYTETTLVSPGYENTEAGHRAYRASQAPAGPIIINELMSTNNRYLIQGDGEYYDWVELKNISSSPVDLSEFALSNDGSEPYMFVLPKKTLNPGEVIVIICSGKTELTGTYIHAPLTLNREECFVYVSRVNGGFSDYIRAEEAPYQGSAGRVEGTNEVVYFAAATPGKENTGGLASIAQSPFVQTPGGVYEDVDSVSVVLSGEGQIRYTTDGSLPTIHSKLYTGPIVLTKSTTIRASCFVEGALQSPAVTTSYIINEHHTFPVLSLSVDPEAMFGENGIYTQYRQDREIPCNLTLFENGEGFSIDCGIKMHGHTGLMNPKKSFKVCFRGAYGESVLNYPVFGEEYGVDIYDSLCMRAGQDYLFAIFREELFVSLCQDMGDDVLTQQSKFCILYVNGEYFGIYNLKEAFSEMYYAQKRGVSEESVEMVQAPVRMNSDVFRFMTYLRTHDMTDPANYEYACSVFNMDSLIDWMIIQGYSTNGDVQQNLRYFRSTENGNTYEMALYDLDWAFYYHLPFTDILSNDRSDWQHLRITRQLIKNPDFREKFLKRLSELMQTTLSTENVLKRIDDIAALLDPEVPRERQRWYGTYSSWKTYYVPRLRNFIANFDHEADIVNRLRMYIGLTQKEINEYFWRWA
jgi:hypothetical protein